jgi:hypothetical protein
MIHNIFFSSSVISIETFLVPRGIFCIYDFFRCFGIVPSLPSSDPNFLDEYILIGRNFKHWQSCNNPNEAKPEELTPLMLRSE